MPTLSQKALALLLCAATLLTAFTACRRTADTAEDQEHYIYNSAAALDCGEDTYALDSDGRLVLLSQKGTVSTEIADIRANSFIWDSDNTLVYTGKDGSIYHYSLSSGSSDVLYGGDLATGAFAMHGDEIWFLGEDALYRRDSKGKVTLELELDGLSGLNMQSDDQIVLYADNCCYIQEEPGDETDFDTNNDQYVSYLYTVSADTVEPFDENLDMVDSDGPQFSQLSASGSGSISINGVSYPFADYPVGSFFTKNGKSCTCHNQGICVESGPNCNCMRYYPTGVKSTCEVDLLSSQCMGFARFCMWRTYGYFDGGSGSDKCYNAFGSKLYAGSWTANTIKNCFTSVGPGGHLRTGSGHSLYVISVSSTGFITYECNMSTAGKNCIIYTRTWTWDTFFTKYGSRDMLYYNLPKDMSYDPSDDVMLPGMYQTLASTLNMRQSPSTSSDILTTIPYGTALAVTEITAVGSYYWGKTTYNGYTGWVRLDYAVYISGDMTGIKITSPPSKTTYFEGDSLDTSGMEVTAYFSDGTSLIIQGYSCTGYNMNVAGSYTVKVSANGFSDSFTITVRSHAIYPTSISLNYDSLVTIEGDRYTVDVELLPEDTTQRTITWKSSDSSVASISNGNLSILKAGEATITATTENKLTATLKITVIAMPTGTEWSVTASGDPLPALPDGIDPQDYSMRYRVKEEDGSWSEWIYDAVPLNSDEEIQCQFRSFTVTFISDGKDIYSPKAVDVNTYVELKDYQLEKDGYLFAGWFSTNQAALQLDRNYAYGSRVKIIGDLTLYAGWIELSKIPAESDDPYSSGDFPFGLTGTALKADPDGVGVRYFTRISSSLISDLEKIHSDNEGLTPGSGNDTGIGYGTLLILESALSGDLTKPSASASYLKDGKAMIIPAVNSFKTFNGYLIYDAYLTGYTPDDYEKGFVARPYLTYKDANGFTHTYYPEYNGENAIGGGLCASLSEVADKAYQSGDFILRNTIEEYVYNVYR
ncbi:MAG: bacterial Ig-like domain-containing protein [Eubacteriales bacterium]